MQEAHDYLILQQALCFDERNAVEKAYAMTFEQSYQLYSRDVWRYAYFLCSDNSLADDITSESFVRLWSTSRDLRGLTLRSYLFTIARNVYIDMKRKQVVTLELDEQISAYSEPAEERIHNSIRMKKFLGLVQQLDPDDRAALLMRTQDEMSFAEIGKKLGIRPEAAKMRVHRAKRRLMEMI